VLRSRPGLATFPLRPALEVLLECVGLLKRVDQRAPYHLYDPCCGGAYMLTGVGFLARQHLRRLSASDISPEVVELARANLGLLTDAGLRAREEALRALVTVHGKASHRAALESLHRLRALCLRAAPDLGIGAFVADAGKVREVQDGLQGDAVDIVMTDVPYNDLSTWRGSVLDGDANPIATLLDAMLLVTHSKSVIALMTLKHTDVTHPELHLMRRLRRGRRSMFILTRV
jgi:23S rRNA (guanine2535-N1)-methyltransferase